MGQKDGNLTMAASRAVTFAEDCYYERATNCVAIPSGEKQLVTYIRNVIQELEPYESGVLHSIYQPKRRETIAENKIATEMRFIINKDIEGLEKFRAKQGPPSIKDLEADLKKLPALARLRALQEYITVVMLTDAHP